MVYVDISVCDRSDHLWLGMVPRALKSLSLPKDSKTYLLRCIVAVGITDVVVNFQD